ncbi:MAG: hypothetical protein KF690_04420 [Bacteroidetes bacterium]|nr:hypothetical protein [Bacteroidota bacterium]
MEWALWGEYISVALLSGFKFLPGVALSLGLGLNLWERILSTGLGGVLGVVVFTYFGEAIRGLFQKYRRRQKLQRQEPGAAPPRPTLPQRLWARFGLAGVSVLVPFLMPAVATAIALSFGTPRAQVLRWMIPSILVWALLFGIAGNTLLDAWEAIGLSMSK